MEDFNIALAIKKAKEKVANRFGGLCNTVELKNSLSELFNNQSALITINNIRGKCTEFESDLNAKISTPEEVDEMLKTYTVNNQEQLRIDTTR